MTPDEAHEILSVHLTYSEKDHLPDYTVARMREAWRTLDCGLRGSGDLPTAWARLGATQAAQRAGKPDTAAWGALVAKGYAPQPDGHDDAGRAWWHPKTVNAYVNGTWTALPKQRDPDEMPPLSGTGGGRDAWARWAQAKGVEVGPDDRRSTIQAACRKAGLLND